MVNLLTQEMLVPYVIERLDMVYSEDQKIGSLGAIQEKLKLMSLFEYYAFILIILLAAIGGISIAIASKFIHHFSREQRGDNLKSTIVNGNNMDDHESLKNVVD